MRFAALIAQRDHPFFFHLASARAALAANDCPVDAGEVKHPKVFEQRLDREESHLRGRILQIGYAGQAVLAILHAHSPPDVLLFGCETQTPAQQFFQPRRFVST